MELTVPELGEGIASATVIRVLVKPGDTLAANQDAVEVETEKASMTIAAEAAGTVEKVLVKPGDKVKVGAPLLTYAGKAAPAKAAKPAQPATSAPPPLSRPPTPPPAKPAATGQRRVEYLMPDLGEGITQGTVVSVEVQPGDTVAADQTLIMLETDKATIPVPAPAAGEIEEIPLKPGQVLKVGGLVAVIRADAAAVPATREPVKATTTTTTTAPPHHEAPPAGLPKVEANGDGRVPVPAGPATRRLARELGVDLGKVSGTAPGGRITADDVKAYVHNLPKEPPAATAGAAAGVTVPPLPDFSKYGSVEKKPFTSLRKAIARNLTVSWNVAPQVTQHDIADITELEAGRKRIVESAPKGSPKVTMTVLAIKAVIAALREFPHVNASYDPNAGEYGELILKRYYHIGIAVDTERGLVVPVIRDADKKSIRELAKEMSDLAEKARSGKLALDEMRGGTFTISNLGGIGGTAFSPIVNYPEVAILGLSRSSLEPVVHDGAIVPRLMLPLSFTYDHRVIDGADGARFTARLAQIFSDPMRLLFES